MDANQFDGLARSLVKPASRRRAFGVLTGGTLFGAFALGQRTTAAQASTCVMEFRSTVRLGPTSQVQLTADGQPGEVLGQLSFGLAADGALENGSLALSDGTALPVVGQATGNSLHLRINGGQGLVFVNIGVGEQPVARCQGAFAGVATGPQTGDLGDWEAVASGSAALPAGQGNTGGSLPVAGNPPAASGRSRVTVGGGTQPSGPTGSTGPSGPSGPTGSSGSTGSTGPSGPTGSGEGAPPCPGPGEALCNGVCVDTSSDPDNCGTCGTVCPILPSQFECIAGVCTPPDCGPGLTDCSGLCDDLQSSPLNCGTCGVRCAEGENCVAGVCTLPGGGGCVAPLTKCPIGPGPQDFICVDFSNDPGNCGSCGTLCPADQTCVGGACSGGLVCNPGLENCFGVCIDTSNNAANCGACGVPCPAGQLCQSKVCVAGGPACAPGLTACGGVCLDLNSDPFACGACTNVCPEGQTCVAGVCNGGA